MAGLLSGLTVLELTSGMAGAVAGMLLADNGANVIKIEPPDSDPASAIPADRVWNRGKRSAVLDLKLKDSLPQWLALCSGADIFIETLSQDAKKSLVVDFDRLGEQCPHLIHVNLSGFGENAPADAPPGYEHLVDAWLGLCEVQGGYRQGPKFNAYPIASYGAAFLGVTGALAALHARSQGRGGQQASTSLVDGAFFLGTMLWHWHEKGPPKVAAPAPYPMLQRRHLLDMGAMECGDARRLIIHTGVAGRFAAALKVLGLDDKITPAPPQLEKNAPLSTEERSMLLERIPQILRTRPRDAWIEAFQAADVCCLPVDPPGLVFDDPQTVFDGVIATLDDPELGRIRMVGPTLKCPDAPPRIARPAPRVGEHTAEVFAALAASPRTPAAATTDKAMPPLAGIRIVDAGNFYAGPGASRILCDLGAEVIKIEPPQGDIFRGTASAFPSAARGKRSLALDMKTPEGREIARQLASRSDAVTHNMRPGVAERLGLDYATLRTINPRLVYLHSPGFGSAGPRSGLPAFAPLLSGMSGIGYQSAGQGNPPLTTWISNEDQVSACMGAIWLLMGLHYRQVNGRGVYLESSLFSAALFSASEVVMNDRGESIFRFALDGGQMGYGPLCRLYRSRDGWIMLVAPRQRHWAGLTKLPGLAHMAGNALYADAAARSANAAQLATELEGWFAARSSAEALALLRGAGVPATIPAADRTQSWFLDDANLRDGRVAECTHPEYGRMRTLGNAIRFSKTPGHIKGGPPLVGEHSRDILAELGYSPRAIDDMRERNIIACANNR